MASSASEPTTRLSRRAGAAGLCGTLVEYFEFATYGLLTVVIAPQFFPSGNDATAILSGLAVFAAGYLVRPLGGIFFGRIGDRRGRKTALVATVVGMGAASVLLGLLPTYDHVGFLAPVLLVVLRLVQGFFAGGEMIGASTYVAETAPRHRRGFYAALTPIGATTGIGLAGVCSGVIALITTSGQMAAWGWRIPFLLCLPLALVALWVRGGLEDSPDFQELAKNAQVSRTPFREALKTAPMNIVRVAAIALMVNAIGAVGTTYMVVHLIADIGMAQSQVFLVSGFTSVFSVVGMLVSGSLSDRIGKPQMLAVGLTLSFVLAVPAFWLIGTAPGALVVGLLVALWQFSVGVQNPPMMGTFAELFPPRIRYTAAAFGFNIGVIFGAGLTPYAAQWLAKITDSSYAPSFLVLVVAGAGLAVLFSSGAMRPVGAAQAGGVSPTAEIPVEAAASD
ncbi:MFS transporter [Streptomyces sp. NPDC005349]|uniref:MFS transporter n=1 Tax=Streptomyces sp. NPDC005349 TaxID=3157037 RepID=UPI0033ABF690